MNSCRLLPSQPLIRKISSNLLPKDGRRRIAPGVANEPQFISNRLLNRSGWLHEDRRRLLDNQGEDSGRRTRVVFSSALVLALVVGFDLVDPDDPSVQDLDIGAERSSVQPSPGQLRGWNSGNDSALEEDASSVGDDLPGIRVEVDGWSFPSLNFDNRRSSETRNSLF